MIAVTFAVPQESKDFLAMLRSPGGSAGHISRAILGNLGSAEVLLVHTGIGKEAAESATAEFLSMHEPKCLLSAGFAGALQRDLKLGDILLARNYSEPALFEKCHLLLRDAKAPVHTGEIVSQDLPVETPAAKAALHARSGAAAVDMETSAIHSVCHARGVPFQSIRAISDVAASALPVPFEKWFNTRRQRPRPIGVMAFLIRHPRRIKPFVRFVQGLDEARRNLTRALAQVVPHL